VHKNALFHTKYLKNFMGREHSLLHTPQTHWGGGHPLPSASPGRGRRNLGEFGASVSSPHYFLLNSTTGENVMNNA